MQRLRKLFRSVSGSPLLIAFSLLTLPLSSGAGAQTTEVSQTPATAAVIPQQVRYAGALPGHAGEAVEAVFKIYAGAEGGEALWTETQRISVGRDGTYTVLLGAASESGLPQGVFAAGQARWLGVTVDRAEGVRAPLASVAYAMKAGDAETVGGLAAANLATKDDLAKLASTGVAAVAAAPQIQSATTPTGSGTADYVPLWTASSTLGNSGIYQAASGFVGIGTTTPGGPLQLSTAASGGANATMMLTQTSTASGNYYADIGLYNSKGLIGNLSALGSGYPAGNLFVANDVVFLGGQQNAGTNLIFLTNTSGALKFGTGGFAVSNERMRIGAAGGVSVGNSYVGTDPGAGNLIVSGKVGVGTTTPAAVLEVNGTAKFDGLVTFASGQTFPGGGGAGTITGITTTSPLTGSGTSGSVALGLNTSALEDTLSGVYASLATNDTFAVQSTFSEGLVASQSLGNGYAGVAAQGMHGSMGVYGGSDTGQGVEGAATAPVAGSSGVLGILGYNTSSSYTTAAQTYRAGVWADSSAPDGGISAGLVATADDSYGIVVMNNSASYRALSVENASGQAAEIFSKTIGDGLDVTASDGNGVDAVSGVNGSGVVGITHGPAMGYGGVVGISKTASETGGVYNVYGGVWGDTGTDSSMTGSAMPAGVYGSSDNGRAGIFLNKSSAYPTILVKNYSSGGTGNVINGLFDTLMATSATGTCGIGGGSMSCTGPVKSLVSSGGGSRTVETYATQSPENWMEDYGTGTLAGGAGVVQIDPGFAETVTADASYHVFLTPHGDSKGLYVTNLTQGSFEVRESGGGTSSMSFDYKIVGKRRGYEAQRLTDVSETFTREIAAATPLKVEGGKKVVRVMQPASREQPATKQRHAPPGSLPRTVVPRAATAPVGRPM